MEESINTNDERESSGDQSDKQEEKHDGVGETQKESSNENRFKVKGSITMFRAAFHTGYIQDGVLRLSKNQLDGANKDDRFKKKKREEDRSISFQK